MVFGRAAGLIAAAFSFAAFAADPAPDPRALIDAARTAMGGAPLDATVTWNLKGTIATGGLDGTYDATVDLTNLSNVFHYVLGPTSGGNGWDGQDAWTIDTVGDPRIENGADAIAQARLEAYRSAFGFLFPDRFDGHVEYAGEVQADGRNYEKIKVTMPGTELLEVWFDASTHRPARLVRSIFGLPATDLLDDYRQFGGIWIPSKTVQRINGDARYDTVTTITSLEFSGAEPAGRYASPAPARITAQWPQGVDSVTVPFRQIDNLIYVDASINGSAPLTFAFDTGATSIVQASEASRLGIPVEGRLPMVGFGGRLAEFGFARVKSISLGGLVLTDQVFAAERSSGWRFFKKRDPSAGFLGYDFLKCAVLTIDYTKKTLTFTKNEHFQAPAGVEAIPIRFDLHVPMIPAKLDGIEGEFQVDSGSYSGLMVMKPFADAHGLVAKYHATHLSKIGEGVGGPSMGFTTHAGQFVIGAAMIDSPLLLIMAAEEGVAAMPHVAGNIGGDLLKRFRVTLDYADRKLWLEPEPL